MANGRRDIKRTQSREPSLGNRLVEQVRSTLTRIGNSPFQYQVVNGTREHRRAPVREFPFGVWYRVEPDESVVVACLAHRADPAVATGAAKAGADVARGVHRCR